jgi:hypothetical protein
MVEGAVFEWQGERIRLSDFYPVREPRSGQSGCVPLRQNRA